MFLVYILYCIFVCRVSVVAGYGCGWLRLWLARVRDGLGCDAVTVNLARHICDGGPGLWLAVAVTL